MSVEQDLLFDVNDHIASFTLNRPDQRNAFTDEMIDCWVTLLEECEQRDDVRVILFKAVGKSFCSGADTGRLSSNSEQTPVQARDRMTNNAHRMVRCVARMRKPVIAAVNGPAVGGGMDLALMCDIRLASSNARFAETYAKMGLLPGVGGAWFLPRLVGQSMAMDLFLTARWVEIDEAKSLGLVDHVYPSEDFEEAVVDYARTIAAAAPLSVKGVKALIKQGLEQSLDSHLDNVAAQLAVVRSAADHKEALAAFKEKRKPIFEGK